MWTFLVRVILRYRFYNLLIIGLISVFMAYKATQVKLSYEFAQVLPLTDSTNIRYQNFKKLFGEDGSIFFVAMQDSSIYSLEEFRDFYDLTYKIKSIEGVEEVVSLAKIYRLEKNDSLRKFEFNPIVREKPATQEELDSLKEIILSLPFYEGLLYNRETNVNLMMITLKKEMLNTKKRVYLVREIKETMEDFGLKHNITMHYSGLPYIRTITSQKTEDELLNFVFLALIVASVILFIFFRSFKAVFFPIIIVITSVIWAMGSLAIFGYKITMLTGIIPPLLIVIVVENCIFLLNKYHNEYKSHGNKIMALSRVVQRIGNANFLTNTTTAAGFAAFIVTGNKMLVEFGVIASVNILFAYFLTLFLIPTFFSYLSPPKKRHMKHLEKSFVGRILDRVVQITLMKRKIIYAVSGALVIVAIIGISKLTTTGNVVDDIPKKDPLYQDLLFIEKHFNGVMPLEISVDTRKKKGVMRLSTLSKIDRLQDTLQTYPELSKPLSVVEVVKSAKQAFYNGNPGYYSLPGRNELNFMGKYIPEPDTKKKTVLNSLIDTNLQITRVSVQMKNIGTKDIQRITDKLRPQIDSIFPADQYKVEITGTSVVFLKGTEYLVRNLVTSLILALVFISVLMALLFTSFRMILISMIPNLLPQIMTAAMMGYLGISIKPSTILIFSIALGISVDNAIHFLSRYRIQLKLNDWNIKPSVIGALKETGYSMIYSSVVLFFGFAIFILSTFGGIEALGYLVSFTLIIALLSNLFLLPSLILSLDKWSTTKAFEEPLLEIFDEVEDIELDDLEIEIIDTRGSA